MGKYIVAGEFCEVLIRQYFDTDGTRILSKTLWYRGRVVDCYDAVSVMEVLAEVDPVYPPVHVDVRSQTKAWDDEVGDPFSVLADDLRLIGGDHKAMVMTDYYEQLNKSREAYGLPLR